MIEREEIIRDSETGEIFKNIVHEVERPEKIKFKGNHRFSKVYHIEMANFENRSHYMYFYRCLCHVEMSTNRIIKMGISREKNISLNVKDIAKLCEVTPKSIYEFLDYCIQNKIIRRLDLDGEFFGFFINPIYIFNGEYIDPILYLMFNGHGVEKYIDDKNKIKLKNYILTRDINTIVSDSFTIS